jgi:hypothetical protein
LFLFCFFESIERSVAVSSSQKKMSDYVTPGGQKYVKSVYFSPQAQSSQQQLMMDQQFQQQQQQQGILQQLPNDSVPVFNHIQTPPGVKLVSFQQDVTASVPPQFQQQLQQHLQQQQPHLQHNLQQQFQQTQPQNAPQQQQENNNNLFPVFRDSDYAAGWENQYHYAPVHVVQQNPQQFAGQDDSTVAAADPAVMEAAKSEYEQAKAHYERASERLNQLSRTPKVQFSSNSQASQGHFVAPQQYQHALASNTPSAQASLNAPALHAESSGYHFDGAAVQPQQLSGFALKASSSDYHFDDLRGLHSAISQNNF